MLKRAALGLVSRRPCLPVSRPLTAAYSGLRYLHKPAPLSLSPDALADHAQPLRRTRNGSRAQDYPEDNGSAAEYDADGWAPDIGMKAVLDEANMGIPTKNMKTLRTAGGSNKNTLGLAIRISSRHIVPWPQALCLEARQHPMARPMLKRYIVKREPFWWSGQVFQGTSLPKVCNCARQKLGRAVGRALVEALRRKGYDKHGRRLPGAEEAGKKQDLYGSLQFIGLVGRVLGWKHEDMVEYFEGVLDSVERELRGSIAQQERDQKVRAEIVRRYDL